MSDDLLERATAALRDTTSTPPDDAARQRAKLLAQAAKRTKPTPIWQWAAVAFGGLFVSSAMAQLGGYMPMIMRALTREETPAAAKPHNARKTPPQASATAPEAPTPSAAPDTQPPSEATPDNPPPSAATSAGPTRAKPARRALAPKRAPTTTPEPTPEREPEPEREPASTPPIIQQPSAAKPIAPAESADLTLFRRAQKLHLAHSPEALAAWDAYLRVAKQGTLVPEARYNRALCLVWLRHYDDARAALEPFAEGKYKGYRQAEAKALLARIPQ